MVFLRLTRHGLSVGGRSTAVVLILVLKMICLEIFMFLQGLVDVKIYSCTSLTVGCYCICANKAVFCQWTEWSKSF